MWNVAPGVPFRELMTVRLAPEAVTCVRIGKF
jgi:hypothetical protein